MTSIIPPFQQFCDLARAANPSFPQAVADANLHAAKAVLGTIRFKGLPKTFITRMIAGVLASGRLELVDAFQQFWVARRHERDVWAEDTLRAQKGTPYYDLHDRDEAPGSFRIKPMWGGTPHPDAARFWVMIRDDLGGCVYRALFTIYQEFRVINHMECQAPQHEAMLRSLLLVPGPWTDPAAELLLQKKHPIVQIGCEMMNTQTYVLPAWAQEAIHAKLQESPTYAGAMIEAYARQRSYGALAVLRALAPTGVAVSALFQHGVASHTYPSAHAATTKVLDLPDPAYLRAILGDKEGVQKAGARVKASITHKAKAKSTQRGPHNANTPEALAKRAARAAKKAALAQASA